MTQENIPHMRRCLRPPPKSEEDFEKIIFSQLGGIYAAEMHIQYFEMTVSPKTAVNVR